MSASALCLSVTVMIKLSGRRLRGKLALAGKLALSGALSAVSGLQVIP